MPKKQPREIPIVLIFVAITAILTIFRSCSAHAEEPEPNPAVPSVSVSVAEGMVIVFKDGHTQAGGVSTRFHLSLGWKLPYDLKFLVIAGVKVSMTGFHPLPRAGVGLAYSLTDKVGLSLSALYEFGYDYEHGNHTHFIGAGLTTSYKASDNFSLAFTVGPGATIGGNWTLLLQPGVSYVF